LPTTLSFDRLAAERAHEPARLVEKTGPRPAGLGEVTAALLDTSVRLESLRTVLDLEAMSGQNAVDFVLNGGSLRFSRNGGLTGLDITYAGPLAWRERLEAPGSGVMMARAALAIRPLAEARDRQEAAGPLTAYQTVIHEIEQRDNYALAANLLASTRWVDTFYDSLTQRRAAAVALAAGSYAVDHGGTRPATIDTLVPDYLPRVPTDATTGEPMNHEPGDDEARR
jgi:hypothetical protein